MFFHGFSKHVVLFACCCMAAAMPVRGKSKVKIGEITADSSAVTLLDRALSRDSVEAGIAVRVRADGDSVIVRWAPQGGMAWVAGKTAGYRIDRFVLRNGSLVDSFCCTPQPKLPWPRQTIIDYLRRKGVSFEFAVAAQLLMGRTGEENPGKKNTNEPDAIEGLNRLSMALLAADRNADAATLLGLRLVDTTINKGFTYVYRASIPGKDGFYGSDTTTVGEARPVDGPDSLLAYGGDRRITLTWKDPVRTPLSGYVVERADDTGAYHRLNTVPLLLLNSTDKPGTANFIDTNIVNGRSYCYRVWGFDVFGVRSSEDTVCATARVAAPPLPRNIRIDAGPGMRVILQWDSFSVSDGVAGLRIYRSPRPDSVGGCLTQSVLPFDSRRFVDSLAVLSEPYYYITIFDSVGNHSVTPPLFAALADTVLPSEPRGVQGVIDTNGRVRLTWRRNPERHIAGYRILQANDSSHAFISRTPHNHPDTVFTDSVTLSTLTRMVFYRVMAVSVYNLHSPPSAVCAIRRPDRVAPLPAQVTSVTYDTGRVTVEWIPSPSADAVLQRIFRKSADDTIGILRAAVAIHDSFWVDTLPHHGAFSEYRIVTIDSAENQRSSTPKGVTVPYRKFTIDSLRLFVSFLDDSQAVRLAWEIPDTAGIPEKWLIYRAVPGYALSFHRRVGGNDRVFIDTSLGGSGEYSYALQAVNKRGIETNLSTPVSLTVAVTDSTENR